MYHVCDRGKISESVREKSERNKQNGDDIDLTDKRQILFTEKSSKISPGACPVTDRHFNICFIGLNMHRAMRPLNYNIHVIFISTFPPSLTSCILNVVDRQLT